MKAILTIVFFLIMQSAYSQTDSEKPQKKPSWGSKMPTRESAPNLKFDADLDEEDEMDMGEFGMDRSKLLDSDETEIGRDDLIEIETPVITSAEEERIAIERQKEQQRKAEEERIVIEQQKEQLRKAEEERIATEQLKEQQRKAEEEKVAAAQVKERQGKTEERRIAEEISSESLQTDVQIEPIQDKATDDESQLAEVLVKAPEQIQPYLWKKIKNTLPIYPTRAARDKKEGWVEVNITIDPTGKVVEAVVVKSSKNYRIFNNSALKAVKKWKFEPPSKFDINNQLSKVVRIVFQL